MGVQAKNAAAFLIYLFWFSTYCCRSEERRALFILVLDYTVQQFAKSKEMLC